jgi:hypothetical protein
MRPKSARQGVAHIRRCIHTLAGFPARFCWPSGYQAQRNGRPTRSHHRRPRDDCPLEARLGTLIHSDRAAAQGRYAKSSIMESGERYRTPNRRSAAAGVRDGISIIIGSQGSRWVSRGLVAVGSSVASVRHRRGRGLLRRDGPLSFSAHEEPWEPNHSRGTGPNYGKLAAGIVPHIPLPVAPRAAIAAPTFHNRGLCITTLM